MRAIKLKIKPYRNRRTGSTSWQVSGTLNGTRIRNNYPDKTQAVAAKRAIEVKALQETTNLNMFTTTLSEAQLRLAENAFSQIKDKPYTLDFCVNYTLTNHKEPDSLKLLSEAKEEYILQREDDERKNRLKKITLEVIKCHMKKLVEMFPTLRVAELDVKKIIQFCEDGGVREVAHNNRRNAVSRFLKFALEKEWIIKNPIDKVPRYDTEHMKGSASSLSVEQARAVMEFLETYKDGRLVPFYALALFAGIRPYGEMLKLPIEAINLENGIIHIDPKISKVGMKRHITIQPNLAAWLKAYPLDKYPIIVPSLTKHRTTINTQFNLGHDILRHTFISMHVGKFRSMGDTALQAGNSEAIIRKHYYAVKSRQEAKEFFRIMPKLRLEPDAVAEEENAENPPAPPVLIESAQAA